MKAVLQISNANLQIRSELTVSLGQSLMFGRSDKNDFVLEDNKMSSKHCRIELKEDRLEIHDLTSKNGTFLNGIKIDQSEIFIGDEIRIGDTFITLLASKLDQSMISILTFPGPFKERVQYELKVDFTGAREKNQTYSKKHPGEKSSILSSREVELRKRAKTKIHLSKEEIKAKSPLLSFLSFSIDLTLLLSLILLPVYIVNKIIHEGFMGITGEHFATYKIIYISVLEILITGFYLLSQKYMTYTFGEKISGIEDLHLKQ